MEQERGGQQVACSVDAMDSSHTHRSLLRAPLGLAEDPQDRIVGQFPAYEGVGHAWTAADRQFKQQ